MERYEVKSLADAVVNKVFDVLKGEGEFTDREATCVAYRIRHTVEKELIAHARIDPLHYVEWSGYARNLLDLAGEGTLADVLAVTQEQGNIRLANSLHTSESMIASAVAEIQWLAALLGSDMPIRTLLNRGHHEEPPAPAVGPTN